MSKTQPVVTVFECFALLECNRQSTEAEIKSNYRRLAGTMHPDRGGDTHQFARLALAYRMLTKPELRRRVLAELDLYGDICDECNGNGVIKVKRKFRVVDTHTCARCFGAGVTR